VTADGLTQPSEQSVFWCDAEQSRPNAATCATKRNAEKHRMAEWKLETDTVLVYIAKDTFSNLLKPVFFCEGSCTRWFATVTMACTVSTMGYVASEYRAAHVIGVFWREQHFFAANVK